MASVANGIAIASDRSGSGKTTVASILAYALSKMGVKVRAFKVGPDYIDPGHLALASGSPAVNLDLWLMGVDGVRESFCRYSRGFDISIVEGVMGIYDGEEVGSSTYGVVKALNLPVVLVVDCSKMSYTAGAIVKGVMEYGNVDVRGVVFNMVSGENHHRACASSLPKGVVDIGYIPADRNLRIEERHLGLLTIEDARERALNMLKRGLELVNEGYIDVDKFRQLAKPIECQYGGQQGGYGALGTAAVAYDSAFSFYYTQTIDMLKDMFKVVYFSPLNDEYVGGADLIYIGGGYPELHLKELEEAQNTRHWLLKSIGSGSIILAECGGLMYLSRYIRDDREYRMVGAFDVGIVARGRLTIGYTELEALSDSPIVEKGRRARGHEFHISYAEYLNERPVFRNIKGRGILNGYDGVMHNNALATYSHLYLPGIRGIYERFRAILRR